MFTGIITHSGIVEALEANAKKDLLLKISTQKNSVKRKLEIGCSIACSGICLTLISKKIVGTKIIFSFQASKETCEKTSLKNWQVGKEVNLEFALRMGDELGGHMVLGHVDTIAKIAQIKKIKDSTEFIFQTKKELMKFITPKGSIVLDGISLTVNDVKSDKFSVNIIPHTLANTALKAAKIGDEVNLEIDVIARYAAKILEKNVR